MIMINKVKVNVKYELGHSNLETWTYTDYHCILCTHKSVWESDGDDYYVGSAFLCIDCGACFFLPSIEEPDYLDIQRMEQIHKVIDNQ